MATIVAAFMLGRAICLIFDLLREYRVAIRLLNLHHSILGDATLACVHSIEGTGNPSLVAKFSREWNFGAVCSEIGSSSSMTINSEKITRRLNLVHI